jgi:hypothetical protein
MAEAAHARNSLPPYVTGKKRAEPIPPEAHRLMAYIDASLEQQILDVPQ